MMNTHIAYGKAESRSVQDVDKIATQSFVSLFLVWFLRVWSDAAFGNLLVIK